MKTTLLLGSLSAILIVGGRAMAVEEGLKYCLIRAVGMNFFSCFFSEKIALMSAQAQPLSQTQHPEIYAQRSPVVGDLSRRMGMPMPKLRVTPEPSPNALATGGNRITRRWR